MDWDHLVTKIAPANNLLYATNWSKVASLHKKDAPLRPTGSEKTAELYSRDVTSLSGEPGRTLEPPVPVGLRQLLCQSTTSNDKVAP